jgi:predicted Zn-dependent peptidase
MFFVNKITLIKIKGENILSVSYKRTEISDGIYFNSLQNAPLKTNSMTIHITAPLQSENAAKTAVLPFYLSDTNNTYRTEKALARRLQQLYGANLGDGTLKLGDSQNIQLAASCINNKYAFDNEDVTGELGQILFDCLLNPYVVESGFEEKIFGLKKRELEDSILSEINDKRPYAFKRAGKIIFEGEPAAISNQGELTDAQALNARDAYAHYLKKISESAIEISFAGQSEDDAKRVLETIVRPAFSNLFRSYKEFTKFKKSPLKAEPKRVVEYLDIAQSKMVMAFKHKTDEKIPSHAMSLLNAVIGATPSSKLFMNVREKLSLCYYCSSTYNDFKGCLAVDSGVEGSNAVRAEEEIIRQISLTKKGEITDDEIDNAKRQIINSARTIKDSPSAMISWYFTKNFADELESPEERIVKIQSVTKSDLVNAANTLELDSIYLLTKEEK